MPPATIIIPTTAILLLNLIVIFYVLRERDRTNSGFFLITNALSLILWFGGLQLWRILEHDAWALGLPTLASLIIPANFLYYAGTRPQPFSESWAKNRLLGFVFGPAVILSVLRVMDLSTMTYETLEFRYRPDFFWYYHDWNTLVANEGDWYLLAMGIYTAIAVILLAARLYTAPQGPDRNVFLHLMALLVATYFFAFLFSYVTYVSNNIFSSVTDFGRVTLIPSPSLLSALIALGSMVIVIRQEEFERPVLLSRWIYYSIMALAGFLISSVLFIMFEFLTDRVLLEPVIWATMLVTILIVLLISSLPRAQRFFDQMVFERAREFRELVRESQNDLQRTREELRRAERLSVVGETAAQLAHEIKNPLGPIRGYTEMMREKLQKMEEFPQRETFLRHLSIISEEVENIDEKVRSLLNATHRLDLTLGWEDINKMAQRSAALIRVEADSDRQQRGGGFGVRVTERLAPRLPKVYCNRSRIEEALFNLCRNAMEASGPFGRITLRTQPAPHADGRRGIEIVIEDSGPGFSERALKHLYDPFFTEKPTGTGLGLSVVRANTELHHGELRCANQEDGGAIVTIWLPVEGPAPPTGDSDDSRPSPAELLETGRESENAGQTGS